MKPTEDQVRAAVEDLRRRGKVTVEGDKVKLVRTHDNDDREFATDVEIEAARERIVSAANQGQIEIDEPAEVSIGEDGFWVQAWVFVPYES